MVRGFQTVPSRSDAYTQPHHSWMTQKPLPHKQTSPRHVAMPIKRPRHPTPIQNPRVPKLKPHHIRRRVLDNGDVRQPPPADVHPLDIVTRPADFMARVVVEEDDAVYVYVSLSGEWWKIERRGWTCVYEWWLRSGRLLGRILGPGRRRCRRGRGARS